jgi:hypothetical protein
MNEFIKEMLQLGAELEKTESPMQASMIINDAEILYRDEIKALTIPVVVGQSEQLNTAWKALEWVGFERGNEFDDEDITEMLGI